VISTPDSPGAQATAATERPAENVVELLVQELLADGLHGRLGAFELSGSHEVARVAVATAVRAREPRRVRQGGVLVGAHAELAAAAAAEPADVAVLVRGHRHLRLEAIRGVPEVADPVG
jgi:hypothetical protein